MSRPIDVIATTISGSIQDWGKVKRIVPIFREHGEEDVRLFELDSHRAARIKACELVRNGSDIIISAGGSGTFNAVVEGCHDTGIDLSSIRLGFLRKGSADLIGKVLGMPDDIEKAIDVFVESIRKNRFVTCDVIEATDGDGQSRPRRFVGYGGAEIFGEIPRITENRWMKYYKGILSQIFGDLGPFFVGMMFTVFKRQLSRNTTEWEIRIDNHPVAHGRFQALIIVNGDLGPNLPFAKGIPLGDGDFHLFAVRNRGFLHLPGQLRSAWKGSIMDQPEKWGFESFRVTDCLELRPNNNRRFPLNVDGSILECCGAAHCRLIGKINLISR